MEIQCPFLGILDLRPGDLVITGRRPITTADSLSAGYGKGN